MKLLKLSSDNPKFKTLTFKSGLNILAGLQLTDAEKKTYNGVGKSFSLTLIHLLLGGRLNKNKKKEKKVLDFLTGYGSFTLEFSHKNKLYQIRKNFSDTHYFINDIEVLLSHYPAALRKIFFDDSVDQGISFKQVFNVFSRRYGGAYYNDTLTQQGRPESDFHQRYVNLCLLGVDTSLVSQKYQLKNKISKLDKARKVIESYEALLEKAAIKDLKDKLHDLINDRNNFVIAKNYSKFKKEADDMTAQINVLRKTIHDINSRLTENSDILTQTQSMNVDLGKIKSIYNEAQIFFGDSISVSLDEANEFHLQLMNHHAGKIERDTIKLKKDLHTQSAALSIKEMHRDTILRDLDSKGALEEYNSINERIRTIEREVHELEKYKTLLEGFKNEKNALDLENTTLNANGITYLKDAKEQLDANENKFRMLVKRFYANHGGSFEIKETKDAKYLFDIDVHVPRDGSQGINEVKIFCYDFLLYQLNPELLGFIAHDGCLFSEMDPRQKSMILKVALEYIHNNDLQYFINIGQASLEEILDKDNKINILTSSEKKEAEQSVILKLYDKDPEQRLLGSNFG